MKVNEVREFSIDYNAKKSCNLVDKHGKKVDTYYIKKKQPFFPFMEMLFEASMDKEFPESAIGLLGHAKCDEAFIFNVYVSDGEGGLYARQCGIGTKLSALNKEIQRETSQLKPLYIQHIWTKMPRVGESASVW